jgi:hypothetical protein
VEQSKWAERVPARVGAVGVYAVAADLIAHARTRSERSMRTFLTFVATSASAPLAFLIPPHAEPAFVAFAIGLYFVRKAWVGEWVAERMNSTCPRCNAPLTLKHNTVLYLPHSITCATCRAECWLELGEAPVIDDSIRQAAIEAMQERPAAELSGKPPVTWSPAASDWRDYRRMS